MAKAKAGVDLKRIGKALRLLDRVEKGHTAEPEAAIALKFYRVAKKFFDRGGRFKRPYTRKKKKQ
jgi:hypothetical protein